MSVNVVAVASGIVVTPQVVAPVVASLDGVVVAMSDVSVVWPIPKSEEGEASLLLVPASNVEAASVWFRLELVLFDSKELVDVAVLRPSLWLLSSDKREELKVEGKLSIGLAVGGIKGIFVVMEVVVAVVLLVVRGKVVWVAIVVLVTEVVTLVYVVEVEAVIVSGRKVVLLVELLLSKFVRFVVLGVFVVVAIVVVVAVGVVVVVVVTKVDAIVPDFGHSTKTRRKRFKEKEKCKRKQRNASKDNKHKNTQHAHARTGW